MSNFRTQFYVILSLLLAISVFSASDDPVSIRFSGVPAIGFNPDSGFGAGVVGNIYFDQKDYAPYKMSLGVKAFLTLKGVHDHQISFDQVGAFSLPLRFYTRLGFYSTLGQHYCGRASDAKCDMDRANLAADNLGYSGDEKNKFVNHFYKNRFMSAFGDISGRWLLWRDQAKLELMTSYRGRYYWNRDFKEKGPYEGSLFAKDYKNFILDGYLSTLEIGLMLDKRDIEAAPTSGYWLEASVRGASWLIGSAWDYFGANMAARFYWPLDEGKRVVIASQTVGDLIVGDLPYDAMSRVGGSQSTMNVTAIGGPYIGRGISEQLYVGRIKAIQQLEVRYTFWSFELLKQNFDITAAAMGDLAMTAWDFSRFSKDMKKVYFGFGGGLRIGWNKTFIVRADLGVSPEENFSPKFYLLVGNVF